jgi:hypothetical protein
MIHEITLADPSEPMAPPEKVLRVSAVQDLAFIDILRSEGDGKVETLTTITSMTVSLPALREALDLLRHDVDRENCRPADGKTTRSAKLDGVRFGLMPL